MKILSSGENFTLSNHWRLNDSTDQEDVHVILEYKVGDTWGPIETQRANRFIFHNDKENPYLGGLELFAEKVKATAPDLLVIGGLQMMDNFPFKEGEVEGRLEKLKNILSEVAPTTRIHFEMASFTETKLFKAVLDAVLPFSDSIGMNEQELPNLESILSTGSTKLAVSAYPRTAVMLDQVRHVFALLDRQNGPGARRLSRIHLHTLGYQVVAVRDGDHVKWPHPRAAAAKASLTANRHTCGLQNIDIERSKMLVDDSFAISANTRNSPRVHFNATEPVSCWHEGSIEFCVAPVLVCTRVRQTAGGGDNISAATLAIQL